VKWGIVENLELYGITPPNSRCVVRQVRLIETLDLRSGLNMSG